MGRNFRNIGQMTHSRGLRSFPRSDAIPWMRKGNTECLQLTILVLCCPFRLHTGWRIWPIVMSGARGISQSTPFWFPSSAIRAVWDMESSLSPAGGDLGQGWMLWKNPTQILSHNRRLNPTVALKKKVCETCAKIHSQPQVSSPMLLCAVGADGHPHRTGAHGNLETQMLCRLQPGCCGSRTSLS